MKPFEVYPVQHITISSAKGNYVFDEDKNKYLDFYGGHAVISIGHQHPHYIRRIENQLKKINFYSNSVKIPIQNELSNKIGKLSNYEDYDLFLCNSGAEANENALKIASFFTQKNHMIAFKNSFHGRTSGAVAITDNSKIVSPFNASHQVSFCSYNLSEIKRHLNENQTAAIIYEPIQGVGNINVPEDQFVVGLRELTKKYKAILIADEVQSGYGRTGRFFAHQYSEIKPDLITIAKGMGNGFPIGGVLVSPKFKAEYGMLGTTFGGNHLACSAGMAVLEVIEKENLISNAEKIGDYLKFELSKINAVKEVRGRGLMIGLKFDFPIKVLKNNLLFHKKIFVGNASDPNIIRLLPPLTIKKYEADFFLECLKNCLDSL